MNSLSFEQLAPGMEIIDEEGYTGVVVCCRDIHQVSVKLTCCTQGYVIYNLDPKGERFEKIYKRDTSYSEKAIR